MFLLIASAPDEILRKDLYMVEGGGRFTGGFLKTGEGSLADSLMIMRGNWRYPTTAQHTVLFLLAD